jgi:hypothetical protein
MILAFMTSGRQIIRFSIDKKVIRYYDQIWKTGIQFMPKDQNIVERLLRNKDLKPLALLIIKENSGQNLKDYEGCKTDEDVAEFVRRDCLTRGLMEIKANGN